MGGIEDRDVSTITINAMRARIEKLEEELKSKDADLFRYRQEVVRVNQALQHMIEQTSQQLRIASQIQRRLSPTEYPNISGFEFSNKFIPGSASGGDYFDIFEHEDRFKFGILLSSASGFGMSSLLLSILLKLTGQMEARKGLPPHQLLENIIRELEITADAKDQASLFYGVVDKKNYDFSYSIAGNIQALHYSYANSKLIQLEGHGPIIAKGYQGHLTTQALNLDSQDRLIICSDGLLSAPNAQGEFFGDERLYRAILRAPKSGVHALRNEILFRHNEFLENTGAPRDVTVIVAEVKDKIIKLAK